VIEAKGISKQYGRRSVLNGLDLKVDNGEIVALMGPNGAGKTTLLRIMSTLYEPSRGDVFLDGKSVFEDPVESRRLIGMVGHSAYSSDDLTALENLRFFWRLYGLPSKGFEPSGKELLRRVGLAHRMNDRTAVFSKGMRQRLAIARAIMHSPKVLLLDEPFSSLDEKGNEILTQILSEERARGCSVVIVSHEVQRIAAVADRADLLIKGRIVQSFDREAIAKGELVLGYRESSEGGVS